MNKYKLRQISPFLAEDELKAIGFEKNYLPKAVNKYNFNLIKIKSLRAAAANILKQTALSKGADLGVATGVVNCSTEHTDAIIAATDKQLSNIIESIKQQPFGLKELAIELEIYLKNKLNNLKPLQIGNKEFKWGSKTYIMGILNITPDSFSDGGKYLKIDDALKRACEMIKYGADIIDIGGESTRPYSLPVDTQTQLERTLPVIKEIKKQFSDVIISIDTRDHKVAHQALQAGADIINDVSGLNYDKDIITVASQNNVPVIIMHSQKTPETMQVEPHYDNLIEEISSYLIESIEQAVDNGINRDKIIIDPGIGFGKTVNHNLEIIKRSGEFRSSGYPLLMGVSRKSFLGKILDKGVETKEAGGIAAHTLLISQGVDILRLHDVKYHSKIINMVDQIIR